MERATRLAGHLRPAPAAGAPSLRRPECTQFVTAAAAAALIPSHATVTLAGFVGCSCPEAILDAIRARHDACAEPEGLSLLWGISSGDKKQRGFGVLAKEGLVSKVVYAWTASAPQFVPLIQQNKIEAYNLPLGIISHLTRAIASRAPGLATKVGLNTFADPREKGGRLNARTTRDLSTVVTVKETEFLWFESFPVHVAIVRATYADLDGNLSFGLEPVYLDQLSQAMAARNSGGIVIAQVARVVEAGSIPAREVHIPGALVDFVVEATPDKHAFTFASPAPDGTLAGLLVAPLAEVQPVRELAKKVMAHRAILEIPHANCVVNLGVGLPENVAVLCKTHRQDNPHCSSVNLTAEAGTIGGTPMGGLNFGTARNAEWIVPSGTMLDFYQGGGIDLTVLGLGEADAGGNVNVSNFSGVMPGCGGFVDISQNSKRVIFMGTLTAGGLKVSWSHGKLQIVKEGRIKKFKKQVAEKTFAGASAGGRLVMFVTERAVFRIPPGGSGLELIEVAPGVDLERQIMAQMEFRPAISRELKLMDSRLFEV